PHILSTHAAGAADQELDHPLHDALPIYKWPKPLILLVISLYLLVTKKTENHSNYYMSEEQKKGSYGADQIQALEGMEHIRKRPRSEEHTSEVQSRENLVCRLLLEQKKRR